MWSTEKERGRKPVGVSPTLPGEQPPWGRHEPPACGKVLLGRDRNGTPAALLLPGSLGSHRSAPKCPEGGSVPQEQTTQAKS